MHDIHKKEESEITSELEQPIWAIVIHDEVIETDLTYIEASSFLDNLCNVEPSYGKEATIVTSDAAKRMFDSTRE